MQANDFKSRFLHFFQFWRFEDNTSPSTRQKVKRLMYHLKNTVKHIYKSGISLNNFMVKWRVRLASHQYMKNKRG